MKDEIRKVVLERLALKGFVSARAAIASFPAIASALEMASSLGFTAGQLGELLRAETSDADLKPLAMRVLVGELHQKLGPAGWPADDSRESAFFVVRAQMGWQGILGRDLREKMQRVTDHLCSLRPSGGWLPESTDDPYLVKAFEQWD